MKPHNEVSKKKLKKSGTLLLCPQGLFFGYFIDKDNKQGYHEYSA